MYVFLKKICISELHKKTYIFFRLHFRVGFCIRRHDLLVPLVRHYFPEIISKPKIIPKICCPVEYVALEWLRDDTQPGDKKAVIKISRFIVYLRRGDHEIKFEAREISMIDFTWI